MVNNTPNNYYLKPFLYQTYSYYTAFLDYQGEWLLKRVTNVISFNFYHLNTYCNRLTIGLLFILYLSHQQRKSRRISMKTINLISQAVSKKNKYKLVVLLCMLALFFATGTSFAEGNSDYDCC